MKRSRVARQGTFTGETKGVALKYVGTGQERYWVGDERVRLDAGELLLLPAETAYRAQPGASGQATTGLCIDFLAGFPEESGFDFLYGGTFRLADLGLQQLAKWEQLANHLVEPELPKLQQEINAFLNCATAVGEALLPVARQPVTRRELSKSLLTARKYVERHYAVSIPLNQLARIAGLSKYHFNRLFKRAFGITPLQWQTKLRMEEAARLIRQETTTLTAIAQTIGYTDLATFSRHFRAYYGVPPSKFG